MLAIARLADRANAARALLVVALVLGSFALWIANPVPLQGLRLAQFDQFQRWHPRPPAAPFVTVVDIDEDSLRAIGQWPWPRNQLATLIERLAAGEPAAIGLDILLVEPDRTSPRASARTQAGAAPSDSQDHDEVLAKSLANRPVVLGANLARNGPGSAPVALPKVPARIVTRGPDPRGWVASFDAVVWPLQVLADAAAGIGALNQAPDVDGVVRRVPLVARVGDELVPGLALESWRLVQKQDNIVASSGEAGLQAMRVGGTTVPSSPEGEFWLHYAGSHARRTLPAMQVLQQGVPAASLRGQVVLVGTSAAGLMDVQTNPLGERMPGVLAHAEALEQIRARDFLERPDWARGLEGLALLAATAGLSVLALTARVRWSATGLAAALVMLGGAAWFAFRFGGVLLDATVPGLAAIVAFGVASGVQYRATEQRQRWLRTAFSRYVSPNRVEHLLQNPDLLNLGGRRQTCSFVFTDLAGFTGMMEKADPAQAVALLNGYLDGMLDVVFRHEGTVDRIVGDAIAVLFSAPVEQPDHRQRALACALGLHAFASEHAQRLRAQGITWGDTRIGVHSGDVIVGNFGGERLFDYRALGDPVNTAARLESVNKHLGTQVCVSAAVLSACPDAAVRPVARLVLKGKQQALAVSTPEAATGKDWAPAASYCEAMRALQQGDPGTAQALFESLAASHPADPLVALHLARLKEGARDDLIVMAEK